jgi:hypothetical protein
MTLRWGGAPDRFGRRKPVPQPVVVHLIADFAAAMFPKGGEPNVPKHRAGLVVAVGRRPRTPGRLPVSSAATGRATRGRML